MNISECIQNKLSEYFNEDLYISELLDMDSDELIDELKSLEGFDFARSIVRLDQNDVTQDLRNSVIEIIVRRNLKEK